MADAAPGAGRRLVGIDVARGLAIMGMLYAHVAPDFSDDGLADGRSSILFATLAGISIGLMTAGAANRSRAYASVALRAVFLVALGLLLWSLGAHIAIILDYYGVMFLVMLPFVFARPAVLFTAAGTVAIVGPAVTGYFTSITETPQWDESVILGQLADWTVLGYYPVLVWLAFPLAGLGFARLGLHRGRTRAAMAGTGVGGMLIGYGATLWGADASAHSGTMWEVLGSGGLALLVIAGLVQLLDARRTAGRPSTRWRSALTPLADAGAMPLTLYTAQILVLAIVVAFPAPGEPGGDDSWPLLIALVVGSLAFAVLWRKYLGKGPLERLLAWVSRSDRIMRRQPRVVSEV